MSDLEKAPKDPKFIASAIFVALIVIAGITLASIYAFRGNSAESSSPTTQATTVATTSSSVCGLPDGNQSIPTEAPRAAWALSGKVAAPRNASYGPGKPDVLPRTCFAHNPTGAVFAAANYLADTANPDVSLHALIRSRIFQDGSSGPSESEKDDPEDRPTLQISGFRVEDATRDRATVMLVVRSTEGETAGQNYSLTLTLGWQRQDWRIVVPATGQPPTSALDSLAGFTPWTGA